MSPHKNLPRAASLFTLLFLSTCPIFGAAWKVSDHLPGFQAFQKIQNSPILGGRRMLVSSNESLPRGTKDGWPDEVDEALLTRVREAEEERRKEEREGKGRRRRKRKVALMFLTRGPMPHDRLWEKWLKGNEDLFSVYLHPSTLGFQYNESTTNATVFYGRQIPNVETMWGKLGLLLAERRLLASALADKDNERFVLLSEKCIPLWSAPYVHSYLMEAETSYFGSYETSFRWQKVFLPEIPEKNWRKGSQWFALIRSHALVVVNDKVVYNVLLDRHKEPLMDETYIQTLIPMIDNSRIENRPVTYVKWPQFSTPHPHRFGFGDTNPKTFNTLRTITLSMPEGLKDHFSERINCTVNGKPRHCYLFARKFTEKLAEKLLGIASTLQLYKTEKEAEGEGGKGG